MSQFNFTINHTLQIDHLCLNMYMDIFLLQEALNANVIFTTMI